MIHHCVHTIRSPRNERKIITTHLAGAAIPLRCYIDGGIRVHKMPCTESEFTARVSSSIVAADPVFVRGTSASLTEVEG